jgi:hypothetical protein
MESLQSITPVFRAVADGLRCECCRKSLMQWYFPFGLGETACAATAESEHGAQSKLDCQFLQQNSLSSGSDTPISNVMAAARDREFALIKVGDDDRLGEQFWVIRLDLVRGSIGRSESAVNLTTARAQLKVLGCAVPEIDELVHDARAAYSGTFTGTRH